MTAIRSIQPLGFPWATQDPFLFCVHHLDHYPKGNEQMGPAAPLSGRPIGQDFSPANQWRMYHGENVPGFPAHPHRGFETVTVVTQGVVDHSDSLGAAGRFGFGDVQWMTAGKGVQHCEMFPLLEMEKENPLELFQIWLNLPRKSKMVGPHFAMLWNENIPRQTFSDATGKMTSVKVIAGSLLGLNAPAPAPDSWAADPAHEVAIWHIEMGSHAQWQLPAASSKANRTLYFYSGSFLSIEGKRVDSTHAIHMQPDQSVQIENGDKPSSLLMLQGQPIGEPVVQYGPFVMNSEAEIQQAYSEFHRTQFGGWPWDSYEHVHERGHTRFARYPDGTTETRPFPKN